MTLPARCTRCDRAFTFETDGIRFTVSVHNGRDGRPAVAASHVPTCPGCQSSTPVPYAPPRPTPARR